MALLRNFGQVSFFAGSYRQKEGICSESLHLFVSNPIKDRVHCFSYIFGISHRCSCCWNKGFGKWPKLQSEAFLVVKVRGWQNMYHLYCAHSSLAIFLEVEITSWCGSRDGSIQHFLGIPSKDQQMSCCDGAHSRYMLHQILLYYW